MDRAARELLDGLADASQRDAVARGLSQSLAAAVCQVLEAADELER